MAQEELTTLPVGRLGLVPLESCRSLGQKVDEWLVKWRKEREHSESDSFAFEGYKSCLLYTSGCPPSGCPAPEAQTGKSSVESRQAEICSSKPL